MAPRSAHSPRELLTHEIARFYLGNRCRFDVPAKGREIGKTSIFRSVASAHFATSALRTSMLANFLRATNSDFYESCSGRSLAGLPKVMPNPLTKTGDTSRREFELPVAKSVKKKIAKTPLAPDTVSHTCRFNCWYGR